MKKNFMGMLTASLLCLVLAVVLAGCREPTELPSTPAEWRMPESNTRTVQGPRLQCAYYPEYNVSLLYVYDTWGYAGGMTGEFFDGNICVEPTER